MENIKALLENEVNKRNTKIELCTHRPDPLLIAKNQNDEYAILLCALFAYGNATAIVKFLNLLNFDLLNFSDKIIEKELKNTFYRFQNTTDIIEIFKVFHRMKQEKKLNEIFIQGYKKNNCVLEGIDNLISEIYLKTKYSSSGFTFFISNNFKRNKEHKIKTMGNSPYKRWNMYLRWMVRCDNLDLGLWKNIRTEDLIIPLDTHTFHVSQRLGLLQRKTYDLESAILLTNKLKEFDPIDPVKYDFALYRIGQEKLQN